MVKGDAKIKLHLKEMELNSLLEITQAINANLAEESLFKIYHFTTIASLHIKKLALYVQDQDWECKVNYGTDQDFKKIPLNTRIHEVSSILKVDDSFAEFAEFEIIIPVFHKEVALAYVFLSGGENAPLMDTSFIQTFTNILVVAIENKKFARKQLQQEALRKELEIARDVQRMLFPKELPCGEELQMYATYLPHTTVGGDYYDYIPLDDHRFLCCIADVSGKGIPASLLMSNFQASLHTLVRQTTDLKQIVHELNYVIKGNAKGEHFITFFVALVDMRNRYLKYINAGHNPPILLWQNGEMEILEKGTIVLGAFDTLPFLEEETIAIAAPMLLFTYTDGLSETNSEAGEEFGLEKIQEFLVKHRETALPELHSSLQQYLTTFKGSKDFPDDITYCSCKLLS